MILVTGATGKLGHHVIQALLTKVPPSEIVAVIRDLGKAADLAEFGVQIRQADYSRPETLDTAFAAGDKLLLISSNDLAQRIPQQQAVVDAARRAGIRLLAYTSILRADTSSLSLARDHKATEAYIRGSGIPFVFLRNGWYLENHTESLASALEHGAILGAAGEGRFSSAARKDYAAAAAAVLATDGHANHVYELAGDSSFTLAELAAEVAQQAHKPVVYRNLAEPQYEAALTGFGLPASLSTMLAECDAGASQGELESSSKDLHTLIGRPTTTLSEAVAFALKA